MSETITASGLALDDHERARLRQAHADVFRKRPLDRVKAPLLLVGLAAYLVFCWFFFAVGPTIAEGRWDRVGVYLSDWYSWEAAPRVKFNAEAPEVDWGRFSPLGNTPDPDWLTLGEDDTVTVTFGSDANRVIIGATEARAWIDGAEYAIPMGAGGPVLPENAPAAITQKGERVTVSYGFAGSVELRESQNVVRRRFFGWVNFIFDPNSAFFGKDFGEVVSLVVAGPDIEPGVSNLSLAWSDFLGNAEWQHGDVFQKLLQTIVMAFVGTLFATMIAFPLAFMAARNITPSRTTNWLTKRFFDFVRSVDTLIWALFFTRGFGPGPLAGIAAISVTDTGALGKLYAEALENIDDKQREGIKSVGAHPIEEQRYGVVPQVLPVFASQALYFWESNTRSATVIGAVGAGGIGLKLLEAMRTNSDWENVAYMVLLILIVVFVFDNISNTLRARLIGERH